jgi:hypothetical protein
VTDRGSDLLGHLASSSAIRLMFGVAGRFRSASRLIGLARRQQLLAHAFDLSLVTAPRGPRATAFGVKQGDPYSLMPDRSVRTGDEPKGLSGIRDSFDIFPGSLRLHSKLN